MILKYSKYLLLALSLITASCAYSTPTHQEILDELAQMRKEDNQVKDNFNYSARYYLDRIAEAKILEKTTSTSDYLAKYAAFCLHVPAISIMFWTNMVLLTPDNAPKLYEVAENVAKKMGYTEMPLIYLAANENLFNAFAAGFLQSMSIVALGEKLVKESETLEALEFVIAHELAHIKNGHMLKKAAFSIVINELIQELGRNYVTPQNARYVILASSLATPLLTSWYSRVCERDADMTAARALGAKGGVLFAGLLHEKFDPHVERDYADLQYEIEHSPLKSSSLFAARVAFFRALSKTYDSIRNVTLALLSPFNTHPSNIERIDYLTELLQQQEAEASTYPAQA